VENRTIWSAILPWVWRILIALAILAAPIITFRAFNDPDDPNPARDQKLRDASKNGSPSHRTSRTNDPYERRP
jgi:hypothetical protein